MRGNTFKFNRDVHTRDTVLFGGYEPDKYSGGVRHFAGLTVEGLRQMTGLKFIDPSERQNESPNVKQILKFMEKYPKYTTHGYGISIDRPDYGIVLEGVERGTPCESEQELDDFWKVFSRPDYFVSRTMFCWFD